MRSVQRLLYTRERDESDVDQHGPVMALGLGFDAGRLVKKQPTEWRQSMGIEAVNSAST